MMQKLLKTKWNAAIDDKTQGIEHVTAFISDYTLTTVDCNRKKQNKTHSHVHTTRTLHGQYVQSLV